jgi:hypothetical protein
LIPQLTDLSESDLQDVLFREMKHWYGDEAGTPDRYDEVAREMWSVWGELKQGPK